MTPHVRFSSTMPWRALLVLALVVPVLMAQAAAYTAQASPQGDPVLVQANAEPIVLKPDAVIYGDIPNSMLTLLARGRPTFDYNGDGKNDFFISYWTNALHPELKHQHIEILLGRDEWPAESDIVDLDGRVHLIFPEPQDVLPGDPEYKLSTHTDVNGDKKEDIVISKKEFVVIPVPPGPTPVPPLPAPKPEIRTTSYELDYFFGQANPPQALDMTKDPRANNLTRRRDCVMVRPCRTTWRSRRYGLGTRRWRR